MKRKNKTSLLKNIVKTLPVLLGVVAVFYVGVLIKGLDVPTLLPVNDIQVQGKLNFLNGEDIRSIVKNNITGGYFTVDLKFVRELLLNKPWVKDVSLRRKWPASLTVFIEEQVPVAYWNNDAYLSEKGDVFKPVSIEEDLNLPALNGPAGQHDNVWKFMNILYKETALLNYEVVRLDFDKRRAWQLIIVRQDGEKNNQIDVKLGRFDTEKRLQRFVRILPALTRQDGLAENSIKVIDMRYPNGFAVRTADASVTADVTENTIKNIATKMNNNKTQTLSRNLQRLPNQSAKQGSEA